MNPIINKFDTLMIASVEVETKIAVTLARLATIYV